MRSSDRAAVVAPELDDASTSRRQRMSSLRARAGAVSEVDARQGGDRLERDNEAISAPPPRMELAMISPLGRPSLIAVCLSALVGALPIAAHRSWAAAPSTSATAASRKDAAHERKALTAMGRARYAAQNRRGRELLDQIEDAETELLNVAQLHHDPHIDAALRHLDTARAAATSHDLRRAEAELAAATMYAEVALAVAEPEATAEAVPAIGAEIFDTTAQKVGNVTEVIFDPDGNMHLVVIGVGGAGTDRKNVAVPPGAIANASGHWAVDRSKRQLQQAQDYRLPDYGGASGTSAPPVSSDKANPGADQ